MKRLNCSISLCVFKFLCFLLAVQLSPAKAQIQQNTKSYDYTKIAEHPRLLLLKGEEEKIKASIIRNSDFSKLDAFMRNRADDLMKEEPLFFKKEGKRLLAVSRKALTRLYYWSYSYRITKDVKYLHRVEKELEAISAFESWNPTHFLDVGEMCMAVSIAYDWLYDDLNEDIKRKVRQAILEKAFAPSYVKEYAWFLERHNNWNSVCNAGLVYGALAILNEEPTQSIAIIERALKSVQLPLKAYGPDGNYPEGPGYWNYGTTFQVMLSAALESALGSDLGMAKAPGFMESAYYMLFSAGPSGNYFNYYDGGPAVSPASSLFWFANKLKDPSLVYEEIKALKNGIYMKVDNTDIERILPNTLVFGKDITLTEIQVPQKKMYTGHGITPVSIVRTDWEEGKGKYLGIKGGLANDAHAHMDQGTFVYDVGTLRWAMDFGLQSYITLESKGVDLWNMEQTSQRWDIFRYNNLNHNTLSINNQRHNVDGKADIIETFDNKVEMGAKVDLTAALNLNKELKAGTRKATIVDNSYLKIEDVIETNTKEVDLRWNMVTPAFAEIVDKNTIKLSQQGKTMFLKFTADIPFKLVIRPSENPADYKCEFGNYKYGEYNQPNKGTVMVGFDSKIPANKKVKYIVTFLEGKSESILKKNTFILDAPNPNTAPKGDNVFSDVSQIGIGATGNINSIGTPDWTPYGEIGIEKLFNKSFKFEIEAKKITSTGILNAGIDRSSDGQLGVRGGESTGIDKNEGFLFGMDLTGINSDVVFKLTKVCLTFFDPTESCTIVNRQIPGKMMVLSGDLKTIEEVKITQNHKRKYIDVSSLGISLKGGADYGEFLSLFNTGEGGSFRIASFEFVVK
ncbi:heparinase II/III domain-containing protein [Pseudopedobacter saltans]|nr:heparinase II/III family protein [Pseudopedobacter saltans]